MNGNFNILFATATLLVKTVYDGSGHPALQRSQGDPFLVENSYTDVKRPDLGPNFYERNDDGSTEKQFMTRARWGIGTKSSFGHDGRSVSLDNVILRQRGEAQTSRDAYRRLAAQDPDALQKFLKSLTLFPPNDTASNLDPGNRVRRASRSSGCSIKLTVLFDDPTDPE